MRIGRTRPDLKTRLGACGVDREKFPSWPVRRPSNGRAHSIRAMSTTIRCLRCIKTPASHRSKLSEQPCNSRIANALVLPDARGVFIATDCVGLFWMQFKRSGQSQVKFDTGKNGGTRRTAETTRPKPTATFRRRELAMFSRRSQVPPGLPAPGFPKTWMCCGS